MEIKVFKEVTQRNLELNFPRHNIAIPISGSGEKLGQNFEKIMTSVQTMTDRFGLCGVIAMHVNGLLTNPKNWSDISYDPVVLKQMFDKWRATGEGESAWTWFDKNYRNKLTGGPNDFAVIDHNKIEAVLPSLAPYQPKVFNADSWQEALVFQQANIASKQNGVVVLDTSTFSGVLGGLTKMTEWQLQFYANIHYKKVSTHIGYQQNQRNRRI